MSLCTPWLPCIVCRWTSLFSSGAIWRPAVKDAAGGVPLFCWPCLLPPSTALSIRFNPFLEYCGKVHAQLLQPGCSEGFSLRHLAALFLPAAILRERGAA